MPCRTLTLTGDPLTAPVGTDVWAETVVELPSVVPPGAWRCRLTGTVHDRAPGAGGTRLPAAQLLAEFPVALLVRDEPAG